MIAVAVLALLAPTFFASANLDRMLGRRHRSSFSQLLQFLAVPIATIATLIWLAFAIGWWTLLVLPIGVAMGFVLAPLARREPDIEGMNASRVWLNAIAIVATAALWIFARHG